MSNNTYSLNAPEISMETRTYRLHGLSELLGSQPSNPDVRTAYLSGKEPEKVQEENEYLPQDVDEKGLTVFLRDPKSGALALMDYVIKGFLKEALKVCDNGIKSAASKVDNFVFIEPRMLQIKKDGEPVKTPDLIFERTLRAMTMQGPRTALAASESVYAPWTIDFTVTLLTNDGTKMSRAVTFDAIEQALTYGRFKGLGQWRNGGYGKFECERIG